VVQWFKHLAKKLVSAINNWLNQKGLESRLTPDQLTSLRVIPGIIVVLIFFCLPLGLLAALIYLVYLVWAVWTDILDGRVALMQGMTTCFGDWYDKMADYLTYTCFFWRYGYDYTYPIVFWGLVLIDTWDLVVKTCLYFYERRAFGEPQEENITAKTSAKSGPSIALMLYTIVYQLSGSDIVHMLFTIGFTITCFWTFFFTCLNIRANYKKMHT